MFTNVKIRKFKGVTGKCAFCSEFAALRCTTRDSSTRNEIVKLAALHRGFFMGERMTYYARRQQAISDPANFMSIITDGMAQVHSELPHLGNKLSFSKKLTQHLQGILEHGQRIYIFRTFENLRNGCNLGIYSLLAAIENRLNDGKSMPRTLYLQIDGGGENTARCNTVICELLVHHGILDEIYNTRLPVGHTHEDIDAKFALIWVRIKGMHLKTPQVYKRMIEQALGKKGALPVHVIDLHVIPDFNELLEPMFDKKYGRYARMDWTQHQFLVKRCQVSEACPLGVELKYRKYVRDQTYEIRKVPEKRPIPFVAYSFESQWFPAEGQPPISLLTALPSSPLKPFGFVKGSSNHFKEVMRAVRSAFGSSPHFINDWETFQEKVPTTDSVMDYLEDHPLHVPMASVLFRECMTDPAIVLEIPALIRQVRTDKADVVVGHKKANPCVTHRGSKNELPYANTVYGQPDVWDNTVHNRKDPMTEAVAAEKAVEKEKKAASKQQAKVDKAKLKQDEKDRKASERTQKKAQAKKITKNCKRQSNLEEDYLNSEEEREGHRKVFFNAERNLKPYPTLEEVRDARQIDCGSDSSDDDQESNDESGAEDIEVEEAHTKRNLRPQRSYYSSPSYPKGSDEDDCSDSEPEEVGTNVEPEAAGILRDERTISRPMLNPPLCKSCSRQEVVLIPGLLLHRRVSKRFDRVKYLGTITDVYIDDDDSGSNLFSVYFDDGDAADFDLSEIWDSLLPLESDMTINPGNRGAEERAMKRADDR